MLERKAIMLKLQRVEGHGSVHERVWAQAHLVTLLVQIFGGKEAGLVT
jgi:hypothetical protein